MASFTLTMNFMPFVSGSSASCVDVVIGSCSRDADGSRSPCVIVYFSLRPPMLGVRWLAV